MVANGESSRPTTANGDEAGDGSGTIANGLGAGWPLGAPGNDSKMPRVWFMGVCTGGGVVRIGPTASVTYMRKVKMSSFLYVSLGRPRLPGVEGGEAFETRAQAYLGHGGQAVDEQDAVEMVDFMLQGACQQAVGFDFQNAAVELG